MLEKKNTLIILIIICVLIRLIAFIFFRPWSPEVVRQDVLTSDAAGYHSLAVNILTIHQFIGGYLQGPAAIRTPAYPLFIAFFYFLFGPYPFIILLVQILIDAMSCYFVYKTAKIFFSGSSAFVAGLLFAVDPLLITYSLNLLSETFFIFCLLGAVYFYIRHLSDRECNIRYIMFSALFTALAILTRPVALYLPFIFIVASIIICKKWQFLLKRSLLYLMVIVACIMPWLIRNKIVFDHAFISVSGEYNMLALFVPPMIMEENPQLSKEQVQQQLFNQADSVMLAAGKNPAKLNACQKAKYWQALAKDYILQHPALFAKRYCYGLCYALFNLETDKVAQLFHLNDQAVYEEQIHSGPFSLIKDFFRKSQSQIIIAVIEGAFLLLTYGAFLWGVYKSFRHNRPNPLLWIVLITIGYFILIAGPAGIARFRLPAMPFIFIISGFGIALIREINLAKRKKTAARFSYDLSSC